MQCEFIQNEHIAAFVALAAQCDADAGAKPKGTWIGGYHSFEVWDAVQHMFSYPHDAIGAPLGSA